jgi:hypothetical protein
MRKAEWYILSSFSRWRSPKWSVCDPNFFNQIKPVLNSTGKLGIGILRTEHRVALIILAGVLYCQRMRMSLCYELQKETWGRERDREKSKRHLGEAHSLLTTSIILPQRLSCYWGSIVSLRMLTNLRHSDLRLTTAQQRSTGQNLPFDLYLFLIVLNNKRRLLL